MSAQQSMTFFSPVGPFTRIFQKKKPSTPEGHTAYFFFPSPFSPVSSVMMESIRAQTGKVVNNSSLLLLSCCLSKSEEILMCFYFLRFDLICPSLFVWRWVNPVSDDNFICSLPTSQEKRKIHFFLLLLLAVCVYV